VKKTKIKNHPKALLGAAHMFTKDRSIKPTYTHNHLLQPPPDLNKNLSFGKLTSLTANMALVVVPTTPTYNGVRIRVLEKDGRALIDIRETTLHYETREEILTHVGVTLTVEEWAALVDATPNILTEAKEHSKRQPDQFHSMHCIIVTRSRIFVNITLHGMVKLLKIREDPGHLILHRTEWVQIFDDYKNYIETLIEEVPKRNS
jgi:hypothetical protein